jgi:hypothetical protein
MRRERPWTKWLMSLTTNKCPLLLWAQTRQEFWIISCGEAIQLAYRTSSVILRCPFVPEIRQGRAPVVFLHQSLYDLYIWPILWRCDAQPDQTNKNKQQIRINEQLIMPDSFKKSLVNNRYLNEICYLNIWNNYGYHWKLLLRKSNQYSPPSRGHAQQYSYIS